VNNRPLDPAIDPNDPRSKYRSSRGSAQNGRGPHLANRSAARGHGTSARSLGFRATAQNVRARIVGTTVQVAAASARLPQARQLAPNGKWSPPSSAIHHTLIKPTAAKPAPLARFASVLQDSERDRLLDPARFLAAIASTKDRQTFNTMVPSESKPAPTPKAAEVIANPSKRILNTLNELVQAAPKPVLPLKAVEAVANLNLLKKDAQRIAQGPKAGKAGKSGPRNPKVEKHTPDKPEADVTAPGKQNAERPKVKIPNVVNDNPEKYEERLREERKLIRQVPTHEFVFPPPNSRSTPLYGDVDAYTDGVPSPGTPNFSTSSEDSPAVGLANMIQQGNAGEDTPPSSATLKDTTPVVGLGISARPASVPEPNSIVEADLLMLESEEVHGYGSGALVVHNPQVSGAAADLIDLEFDNTTQESSTPNLPEPAQEKKPEPKAEPVEPSAASIEYPLYVEIGGIRYYREDQLARAIPPEAATDNAATAPLASAGAAATDRLITGSGYTIGVRHMGFQDGNLVGERNLARRAQESLPPPTISSIWADSPPRATGKRRIRTKSPVRVKTQSTQETVPQKKMSLDPRPAAIGEQNLPGRSRETASRDLPPNSSGESSQVEVCHASRTVQRPQGSTMPREANPWDTSSSFVSTDPRFIQLAGSHRTEATTRAVTSLSQSTTNGPPATRSRDRSSEAVPSGLSEDSIFTRAERSRSSQDQFRSSTSEDVGTAGAGTVEHNAMQHSVSMRYPFSQNLTNAGSTATVPENETPEEQMVRLINSQGSTGMTPLTLERPMPEIGQTRESTSSTGYSKESSRSQTRVSRSRANLVTSKWATEEVGTSSTTNRQFPKPASLPHHVLSFRKSNTPIMRSDGKITTKITRTPAGPGFDLLKAELDAREATSNSRETAAVARTAQFTTQQINSVAPAAHSPARVGNFATLNTSAAQAVHNPHIASPRQTTQSFTNLNATSGRNMPSEPRIRVVNPARTLGRSQVPAATESGRSNNGGDSSSESEP
jgi:hypothetical protein